jgi:hypothetical protein
VRSEHIPATDFLSERIFDLPLQRKTAMFASIIEERSIYGRPTGPGGISQSPCFGV